MAQPLSPLDELRNVTLDAGDVLAMLAACLEPVVVGLDADGGRSAAACGADPATFRATVVILAKNLLRGPATALTTLQRLGAIEGNPPHQPGADPLPLDASTRQRLEFIRDQLDVLYATEARVLARASASEALTAPASAALASSVCDLLTIVAAARAGAHDLVPVTVAGRDSD